MAHRPGLILLLCLGVPLCIGAAASDRDLDLIKKKIDQERRGLSRLGEKENSTVESLGKIQNEIDKRNREIKQANARLSSITGELRARQGDAERLKQSVATRRALLEKRAAALYRWQRSGGPLLLLNGNLNLTEIAQRQRYMTAALRHDRELLENLDQEKQAGAELQQELAERQQELAEQKQIIGAAREQMRRQAEKQEVLLASLRQEKQTRLRALQQMEAAAKRLEKMLDEIARRAALKPRELPSAPPAGTGLASLRGRLEWPVAGEVSAPFGKSKHPEFATEIMRKGIDIQTPTGAPVKAVEKGQVVYADQFAGYGKMVIIDHGERYYTIYGYLDDIYKKKGDAVSRGESLGRAGANNASAQGKLYFEMRKDGHSFDPLPWFAKR